MQNIHFVSVQGRGPDKDSQRSEVHNHIFCVYVYYIHVFVYLYVLIWDGLCVGRSLMLMHLYMVVSFSVYTGLSRACPSRYHEIRSTSSLMTQYRSGPPSPILRGRGSNLRWQTCPSMSWAFPSGPKQNNACAPCMSVGEWVSVATFALPGRFECFLHLVRFTSSIYRNATHLR